MTPSSRMKPSSPSNSPYLQRPGARRVKSPVYMRLRNSAASGPTTSILPSVEASNRPRSSRTAQAFTRDRLVHGLAVAWEVVRAFPGADVFEDRVLVVDRRAADGIEQIAARGSGEGAEGDRRIRRAERCQADLGNRPAGQRGDRCQCVHVGGLALVGRHAGRGVAFDMLDRAESFARRDGEILGRDIVLKIDERFAVRLAG